MNRFMKFEKRIVLKGNIECITPLHIGSGVEPLSPGDPQPVIKDAKDLPYIPGSSFKGVLRAESEKLLHAQNKSICKDHNCMPNSLCMACDLFGSQNCASRIIIPDIYAVPDSVNIGVRTGIAIDYNTGTTKMGAKYDLEFVKEGAKFDFEIIFENPTKDQIKLILTVVNSNPSIGGNRTRGFGQIKIDIHKILQYTIDSYKIDNITSEELRIEDFS